MRKEWCSAYTLDENDKINLKTGWKKTCCFEEMLNGNINKFQIFLSELKYIGHPLVFYCPFLVNLPLFPHDNGLCSTFEHNVTYCTRSNGFLLFNTLSGLWLFCEWRTSRLGCSFFLILCLSATFLIFFYCKNT